VYIAEIAPPAQRGKYVSFNELGITTGILLAYLANYALMDASSGWR
jgi:MFS transporter, SP family, major inositol transporter